MDRNMIIAIVLSMAVLVGWQVLVIDPQREALEAAREAQAVEQASFGGHDSHAGSGD